MSSSAVRDLLAALSSGSAGRADLERTLSGLSEEDRTALLRRMADRVRRSEALVEIADRVSDSLSLDVLFPRIMELVSATLDAERSTLFLRDPESGELFSRVMQGNVMGEVRFPANVGIAGSVFSSGVAETIPDAYTDVRFNQEVDRRTGFRTRNILCVPIRNKRNEVIGVAQALNKRDGDFDQDDRQMLEMINRQAAAALENARIFERVERQQREEAMLLDVVSAIASEIQVDPLLDQILKAATMLLDADRGALFLYDPRTSELYSRVAGKLGAREIRFPAHAGLAGESFMTGDAVNIPDAYADPRFNPEVDRETSFTTRSILCMPIIAKSGHKVGVMEILNKRSGSFGPSDEQRLRALCAQAAVSLENAQLFDDVSAERNFNENILSSMSSGVITLDNEARITKVNRAVCSMIARDPAALIGHRLEEVLGGRNAWVMRSIERVSTRGDVDHVVDTDLLVDGRDAVAVNLATVPLLDASQQPLGYMLMIEDITREKRLKHSMSRYMSKAVVDQLLEGGEAQLGGTAREVSVLFADIRGFTAMSERLGARRTVAMLNEYFTHMVDVVLEHDGILDKFIGDMMMAVFGSAMSGERDADNAVLVGNQMMRVLRQLNARRSDSSLEVIRIGVGVATGDVVVGNIGSPRRLEYTVIGDRVNLAERLESATKHYGVGIILCQHTATRLNDGARLRELDLIRVRGSTRPVSIFEALDHHTEESFPGIDEVLAAYAEGLRLYRQRDWRRAAQCFRAAYSTNPDDRPSHLFYERCQGYLTAPPPKNWDGVWTMGDG